MDWLPVYTCVTGFWGFACVKPSVLFFTGTLALNCELITSIVALLWQSSLLALANIQLRQICNFSFSELSKIILFLKQYSVVVI